MSLRLQRALPFSLPRPLRTPKGLLILLFLLLLPVALTEVDTASGLRTLLLASATAVLFDLVILRVRWGRLMLPDGALLTGMIVGVVLRPQEDPGTVIATSALAVASKHLLRTAWSNIFNPAALALFVSAVLLESGQSWWGAMPDSGHAGTLLLLAAGAFITDRINKAPMVLVFLGLYFALFAVAGLVGPPEDYRDPFRAPTFHAALFFALFILDDPPTSPVRYGDQAVFAAIAAAGAVAVYIANGALYFLLAGLLAANAWESARRVVVSARRSDLRRANLGTDLPA